MSIGFHPENVPKIPEDSLFALKARCAADTRSPKVDLGIGAYRDENGKPWILPSVKLAENLIQNSSDYNHEYIPISGIKEFTSAAAKVILGADSKAIKENKIVSIQSLSGTGALHIVGRFIRKFYKPIGASAQDITPAQVYISTPSWSNHVDVFQSAGLSTAAYPYWNTETKSLDLEGYLKTIESAPEGSIFVLHATAHNPTGLDPTVEQWKQILSALSKKKHLPLFDSAYQGFSSGSLEKDAWAVREAVNGDYNFPGILVCQSFAKNVGMYGERVGAVHIILPNADQALLDAAHSQLNFIVRSEISTCPGYGAKIVAKILTTPELYSQWEKDLVTMSSRILSMRQQLVDELTKLGTPGTWSHITEQQGMFSYTGLTPEQVTKLEKDHAVYLMWTGRASVAGLNESNIKHVANAIDAVVRGK